MRKDKSIGRLISILYRHAKIYFQRRLEGTSLGHGQLPVLMYIITHENVTQHQINEYFLLDKGSTSNLISNLEKNGFITRSPDTGDKRSYIIDITEKTRTLIPGLEEILSGWTHILTDGFKEKEKEEALRLLNRMIENTTSYIKKKQSVDEI